MIKTINFIKDFNVIFLMLLIAVATFPLVKINPQVIFTLIGLQLIITFKSEKSKIEFTFYFWLLLSLFLLNIVGLLYSERLNRGITIVSRQSIIILFPLFYTIYFPKKINLIFKVYIVAIASFIIISELHILHLFFYKSAIFPLNANLFFSYRYTGAELTKLIGIHNAYLGMYIVFSNVLIISFIKTIKKNYKTILLLLLLLFQSLFLFQMVAKTAILLNISIAIPLLIYVFLKNKKIKTTLFLLLLVIVSSWFLSTKLNLPINRIKDRIEELSSKDETSIRLTRPKIWKVAIPIIKNNFILGVGTGDANKKLQIQFEKEGKVFKSNVHNQFLDYFLRFGVVGFTLFTFTLLFALYHAIKTNNYIYFCFTIIIIVCSFTENILSRQWGITFYGYFNFLLFLNASKNK